MNPSKNKRPPLLRYAWLGALPLILAAVVWKVHDDQKPIQITVPYRKGIPVSALFTLLSQQLTLHPHAQKITASWRKKLVQGGQNFDVLQFGELNRKTRILTFFSSSLSHGNSYGWMYENIGDAEVTLVAQNIGPNPTNFPPVLRRELNKRKCRCLSVWG